MTNLVKDIGELIEKKIALNINSHVTSLQVSMYWKAHKIYERFDVLLANIFYKIKRHTEIEIEKN